MFRPIPGRHALGALAAVVGLVLPSAAAYAEGRFGAHDVRTLFVIGKNTDRNEVQYGIRLDADCLPSGDEPVYAYWRVFERGPDVTEDLNFLDRTAYGIRSQKVEQRSPSGSKVVMRLRATPARSIAVYTRREGNACVAEPLTYISGAAARLQRIQVQLAGPLSVRYIDISGTQIDPKQPITERAKP